MRYGFRARSCCNLPAISVRVTAVEESGETVVRIEVPKSKRLVATSHGLLQRRPIKVDGTPECVPFLPYEFARRQSDLGLLDYSVVPLAGAKEDDCDPIERQRLRRLIDLY